MSTSADGDGRPDNGGFDDLPELPDLPDDWGPVVIPDDPAELAAEAAQVRRELRREARHATWRRRLGLTSATGPGPLRLSLLIMTVAILATLTSLFALAWPGQPRPTPSTRTTPNQPSGRTLPALDLLGEDGQVVPLRSLLPALVVLADTCSCAQELDAAARAAPPGVTVVAVRTRRAEPEPGSPPPTGAGRPRLLTDPTAELRGSLRLPSPPETATALLVSRSGRIIRTVPALSPPADYQADLDRLPTAD